MVADDELLQSVLQCGGFVRKILLTGLCKISHIHQIKAPALAAKGRRAKGFHAGSLLGAELIAAAVVERGGHGAEQLVHRRFYRVHFGKIHAGKRQIGIEHGALFFFIMRLVGFENAFGDFFGVAGFVELGQKGVIPAVARLGLLRGYHITGVRTQHLGDLDRGHQAGVKADEVKLFVVLERRSLQRLFHLAQLHMVALKERVLAKAHQRTVAVVPADQAVMCGRIVLLTGGQKIRERVRLAHALRFVGGAHPLQLLFAVLLREQNGGVGVVRHIRIPHLGAAGAEHDIYFVGIVAAVEHFGDVVARRHRL